MGRHGSGAGGGKESLFQAPPVDLYRKRIGRQDSKKEKGHQKEIKHQHEAKEMAPVAYKQSVSLISQFKLFRARFVL